MLETLNNSNLKAAPGTDGLTSLLYKVCWDSLGDALTEVSQEIFQNKNEKLPASMRSAMMVCNDGLWIKTQEAKFFET